MKKFIAAALFVAAYRTVSTVGRRATAPLNTRMRNQPCACTRRPEDLLAVTVLLPTAKLLRDRAEDRLGGGGLPLISRKRNCRCTVPNSSYGLARRSNSSSSRWINGDPRLDESFCNRDPTGGSRSILPVVSDTERKRLRNIVHTCDWLGAPGACRLWTGRHR